MTKPDDHPPLVVSTLVVLALTALWGLLRLGLFRDAMVPLVFMLPMLVCVWTRRSWHLWGMVVVFTGMTLVKYSWMARAAGADLPTVRVFYSATLFNIIFGGAAIQLIIRLRSKLDLSHARLQEQNAELEAQGEELSRQNEEIKVQAEEMAQQNEEIETQSEEIGGQNEELQRATERLAVREEILQSLLLTTRTPDGGLVALEDICRRSLHAIGRPAECIAVLRLDGDLLHIKVQSGDNGCVGVPLEWPRAGSIAGVVLDQDKTAYISDLQRQPELAAPFGTGGDVRSVLATPMRVAGALYGVVLASSSHAGHWTQEQFHLIEWIAAQCGVVTESIRWQKAVAERTREIEAANHAKDQFLAMLSHELRTPLTPVLAAAGVLEQDERVPEDVRHDLQMIHRNVSIQSRLVDDLLDLTKLGRGKLELDTRPIDVAALLKETAVIVAGELDAKDQGLDLELGEADGSQVHGDGPRLQQVFWNLLKNANKFSPSKSRISVRTRRLAGPPRIAVVLTDEGMGIDPQDIGRIFQPFEQVAARGKQRGSDGGLGLGLAIAKAIVELHHGTIHVSSDGVGRGSTFTVELPLVTTVATVPAKSSSTRSPLPGSSSGEGSLRILLVEDHEDTGRVLMRLLKNSGHVVDYAASVKAALEIFGRNPCDLLISDLGLPDESGLELMRKLHAIQPDLPGICLSGYGMEDDLRACREAGFTEHLTKPVDLQRLRAAIARVAAQHVR